MVLGVNTADDRKIALDYLKANQVTFPNVLDASESANRATMQSETLPGMSAVPFTYLIDREGKVVEAALLDRTLPDPVHYRTLNLSKQRH